MKSRDMALEALLRASKRNALQLPDALLRKIYEIQVKYQFEDEREIPLREMSRIVEDYINKTAT